MLGRSQSFNQRFLKSLPQVYTEFASNN